MIGRDDFTFTIGFSGSAAIVDGALKRRYGALSVRELARQGLFKAAIGRAIYDRQEEELRAVLEEYNRQARRPLQSVEELKRIFGVYESPGEVGRVIQV